MTAPKRRPRPGYRWRVLAHEDHGPSHAMQDQGRFDELVVDDWLHIEQMQNRVWWMQLGAYAVWIRLPKRGPIEITIDPGGYDCPTKLEVRE